MVSVKTKHDVIQEIEDLITRAFARLASEDDAEQEYLAAHCSPEAARHLASLSTAALHLLDRIPPDDSAESVNIVGLAQSTGVPKGTVSKTVRRLTAAGLVSRHHLPDNRKEVHLRLTPTGAEIWRAHQDLHAENVLAATREPWLVIDPKPYVGDPAYDVLQHMLNCRDRLLADPRALARRMADLAGLDAERAQLWLFARVVQESVNLPWLRPVVPRLAPR